MRNEIFSVLGGLFSANVLNRNGNEEGEISSRTIEVEGKNFTYQVYAPPQAKTDGNLPVIVFLHGIRERGSGGILPTEGGVSQFAKQYFKRIPAIIVIPQCRPASYWSDPVMDEMVMRALGQTIEEFNADENRLSLIGVSMGGYGVWHFAAAHPGKFAALVSICGGSSILKGDRFSPVAKKVGQTPAWLFHGAADKIVPVSESRELVRALRENDGNVRYNEYENVGHNVWMNVLAEKELMPWLLSQRLK
jgi:predicted peptidase